MALAHICCQCGFELARVRAAIDPHYGLPLVCCPGCGCQQVRRRHPAWLRWRQAQHFLQALTHGGISLLLLFVVIVFSLILAENLLGEIDASWQMFQQLLQAEYEITFNRVLDVLVIYCWLGVAAVTGGAFVTGVLYHWKRWIAWGSWAAILLLMSLRPVVWAWYRDLMHTWYPDSWPLPAEIDWNAWLRGLAGTVIILGVSLFGAPIGWAGVRAARNSQKRRLRKWRRKRRQRQRS